MMDSSNNDYLRRKTNYFKICKVKINLLNESRYFSSVKKLKNKSKWRWGWFRKGDLFVNSALKYSNQYFTNIIVWYRWNNGKWHGRYDYSRGIRSKFEDGCPKMKLIPENRGNRCLSDVSQSELIRSWYVDSLTT